MFFAIEYERKLPVIFLLLMLVMVIATCTLVDPEPEEVLDPTDWEVWNQNELLGKGINLGNALDAPEEGEWGVVLEENYFSHVKSIGFQSVRLPVRWSAHCSEDAPYTIDKAFFDRVTWAVDCAMKNDLRAIINIHHYIELMEDPEGQKPRFLALWKQIAEHFSSYGPELYFELCNEPINKLTAELWNELAPEALAIVRENNPYRTVLIGPGTWNSFEGLADFVMPQDSFCIVEIHYYKPDVFTHQGAEWIEGSNSWLGTKWRATEADTGKIVTHFDIVAAWAQEYGVPVHLGEFGTIDTADTLSRALYTSFIAQQAQQRKWSSAYWKYNSDFGIYDDSTDVTRMYLVDALLRPATTFDSCHAIALADTESVDFGSSQFVVLDDFEDSLKSQNSLALAYMQKNGTEPDSSYCWWSVWSNDSSRICDGDGIRILSWEEVDSSDSEPNFPLLTTESDQGGSCLHMKGYLRGGSYPFLGIGTNCPGMYGSVWFDFSNMTSISFRAKGSGEMRVNFVTDTILNGYSKEDNWGNFGCDFSLTSEWKQFVIPVASLKPKAYSEAANDDLVWEDGMGKVCYIDFSNDQSYGRKVDDSLELYLDDIRLYGMSEADFGLSDNKH